MPGADHDALWRPGFTGTWGAPVSAPLRPRRPSWPTAALATALVGALLVAVVARAGFGADPPRFPAGAEARWTVDVPGLGVDVAAGDRDLVVVADRRGSTLVALAAEDGVIRWERRLPKGALVALAVVEDSVVALVQRHDSSLVLVGLAASDAAPRWSTALGPRDAVASFGAAGIVVERRDDPRQRGLQLVDPGTGEVVGAVRGDDVTWSRTHARRREASQLELFDPTTLAPQRAVELAALGLAGRLVDGAAVGDGTLVAADDTVVLLDREGSITARATLRATTGPVDVQPLDAAGELVAVQAGERLHVLTTGDGLVPAWSEDGWLVDWHVDADRQLVAVIGVSGSIPALPPRVVDARTGAAAWRGRAEVQDASPLRVFGADGFLALSPREAPTSVVGFGLDRVERWRAPLAAGARPLVIGGALVVLAPTGDGTTVSLSS